MSDRPTDDMLLQVFRSAADGQPIPEGSHPVDDDDLLLRWVEGDLSGEEHGAILKHLADCHRCRREIATMVRAGALQLPLHEEQEPKPDRVTTPTRPRPKRRIRSTWAVVAVAATVLAAIVWSLSEPGSGTLLAMAQSDLAAGNPAAALERVDGLLDQEIDPRTRAKAEKLLEEAGYRLAREELVGRNYKRVRAIERRVSRRELRSARLLNLRFQADQKIPNEYALEREGALTDYGYELDGSSIEKGLPTFDENTERLNEEFSRAISKHPRTVGLLLNHGQFLLRLDRFRMARRRFEAVLALDDSNAMAHLGLGLVHFKQEEYQKALQRFETVLEIDPDSAAAHLNAAICLERLSNEPPGSRRPGTDATPDQTPSKWETPREKSDQPSLRDRLSKRRAEKHAAKAERHRQRAAELTDNAESDK